ncbi:CinA family protein [Celeribacter neptunius]|uniref:Nicotinamide-nucleotide amidase n=1 Tax=Celeribacter neptunius TaxID=588602 RepID=A0A1I3KH55_9RHOB|nr:CinA family protein [Celeribacter neptunius]SFI71734.1 nicotinamide-nucleotide amidase [Celeribacter neptunius]
MAEATTRIPADLAEEVLAQARAKGMTIATAESCTGGMIIGSLTEIPGSSDMVDRGFVTYSNAAKREMLGVSPVSLAEYGAVSEQVAREMAEGALRYSGARIAVSVTGIAGPGGSEHKPEGRVCFGLAFSLEPGLIQPQIRTEVQTIDFGALGRPNVRSATIKAALEMLRAGIAGA